MAANLFIISAPSGTGKTTVVRKLMEVIPNLAMAVSCTTRGKRPDETAGIDYIFVDKSEFDDMAKAGKFIEWAEYAGHLYGTPKAEVESMLKEGVDVVLDIDVQGAEVVKKKYPGSVSVFLLPPSFDELKKRLKCRGADPKKDMDERIDIAGKEYSRRHEYDYQVVNENLEDAVDEIAEIIGYCHGL